MISHLAVALSFCCRVMASKQMVQEVNVSNIFPELAFLGCAPHASVWVRYLRRLGTAVSLNKKTTTGVSGTSANTRDTAASLGSAVQEMDTVGQRWWGRASQAASTAAFPFWVLVFDSTTQAFPTVHNSCWPCQSPCYILYRTTNEDS